MGKLYLGVPMQAGKDGPEVRIYEALPPIETTAATDESK
jgi:hypothetical protein